MGSRHGAIIYSSCQLGTALNAGDPNDPRDMFRGWSPVPLSDFGRKTMQQTAEWMKRMPIQQIISSDLPRAEESANMISQATGVPVTLDPRLRPLNVGALTGQVITPELKKVLDNAHTSKDQPIPGGESYNDFMNRYKSIFPDLLQAAQNQNIAVVTHHRNLLALPYIFHGQEPKVKGPPEPGGVLALAKNGVRQLYAPPASIAVYKEHAAS